MLAKLVDGCNSADLTMLSRVLNEALIISVDGSELSEPAMRELVSRMGKLIMDRFAAGETDPERLKAIAVGSTRRQ